VLLVCLGLGFFASLMTAVAAAVLSQTRNGLGDLYLSSRRTLSMRDRIRLRTIAVESTTAAMAIPNAARDQLQVSDAGQAHCWGACEKYLGLTDNPDFYANNDPFSSYPHNIYIREEIFGWPIAVLSMYEVVADGPDPRNEASQTRGCLEVPVPSGWLFKLDDRAALPILPIWISLAISSASIAVPLLLLIQLPLVARRGIRQRRDQCVACGHLLGGSQTCPECGRSRSALA